MRQIKIGSIMAATLALFSPSGYACSCSIPEVPQAVVRAEAVFVGEVIKIVQPITSDEKAPLPGRFYTITFKVEKSWKGVASQEFRVLSAQGKYGGFAYPPVSTGEKYLVYADPAYHDGIRQEGWVIITSCNRTALIPKAGERAVHRLESSEVNRKDGSKDLEILERLELRKEDQKLALPLVKIDH